MVGSTVPLTSIAQGTDILNRVGRHVRLLYIDYAVQCQVNATNDSIMWSIVLDKQPNNTAAAFPDIYASTVANAAQSLQNTLQYRKRFDILLLKQCDLSTGGPSVHNIRGRLPVNRDVEYISSATGVPSTNALIFAFGSNVLAGFPTMNYSLKMVFIDL